MTSHTGSELAKLLPAKSYTSKEWDQKQAIITQLYREEARRLDDVRIILDRDYGFRPSKSTFKKRIQRWGLDRKHKLPDMLYALRVASERKAQGKETSFVIRGRIVTFDEIKHYFRRRGDRDLKSASLDAATTEPTTDVEIRTPELNSATLEINTPAASRLGRVEVVIQAENVMNDFDFSRRALPDSDQVNQTDIPTDAVGQSNRIVDLTRALRELEYIHNGSYEDVLGLRPLSLILLSVD